MKQKIRKTAAALPIACGLLLAAQSASAQEHESYVKAGILGGGVGYARPVDLNEHFGIPGQFGVRADFSTMGSFISRDGTAGRLDYEGELKANQLGVYGDWFPFGGSFRLSAGLHSRKLEVTADGVSNQFGDIYIGNVQIASIGPDDTARATVEWPSISPYIGIGWGHHASQGPGLGFVADIGVSFGSPKVRLTVSDSLRNQMDFLVGPDLTDEAIEAQRREWADEIDNYDYKIFPQLYLGISYRF